MRKQLAFLFAFIFTFSFFIPLAICEVHSDNQEKITYHAVATNMLKMRRAPDAEASANGSISKNEDVYIIEYGDTWCKVKKNLAVGWVLTKYLTNVTAVEEIDEEKNVESEAVTNSIEVLFFETETDTDTVTEDANEASAEPVNFTMDSEHFEENYKAATVSACTLYSQPSSAGERVCNVPVYSDVTVGEIQGQWCLCRYKDNCGFTKTDKLFKWDRINPYCGDIPGLDVWDTLAFVNQSTNIYDPESGDCLKTINPGAAIAATADGSKRYKVGYYRQYAYVKSDKIAYTIKTVPYEVAESGDLLSVMTTYYPVGVHTLQQQGRNWNIRLSSTFITGTVLQPGQSFNMYHCIAPYRKSTGYMSAPIMSPNALSGYGGGTCQVNTTFYNACIALPLLITHRQVHADSGIYYCKQGFDAAVGGGNINLTMENTLPYAIRYQMFISDGVLTCCIFKE